MLARADSCSSPTGEASCTLGSSRRPPLEPGTDECDCRPWRGDNATFARALSCLLRAGSVCSLTIHRVGESTKYSDSAANQKASLSDCCVAVPPLAAA
jgi:hypothetical protein